MANLPSFIKIGPILYEISIQDDLELKDSCNAKIDTDEAIISIDPHRKGRTQAQSLFHEIQHGILEIVARDLSGGDENFVNNISASWLAVLFDSPGLLEYLIELRDS